MQEKKTNILPNAVELSHTEISQSGPWKKESGNKKAQAGGISISRPPATCPAIRCVLVRRLKTILIASVLT